MRSIRLLILLFTGVIFFGSCNDNGHIKKGTENIMPRLNLEEGDQYELVMEVIQSISTNENENEQVIDQSITVDFDLTVDSVYQGNFYLLRADVKEVALTRNIPLKETIEISSQSLNKKDLDSQYVKAVKNLLDKVVFIEVDNRGIIKSRIIKSKSKEDSILNHDRLLPKIFEDHVALKQNLELFFPYYPKDSVVVNQTWSQEFLIQNGASILGKSNLMIDSIFADTLSMHINTTLNQQKSDKTSKNDMHKSRSGTQTIDALIEKNSGWPLSVEIVSEVKVMEKIGLKILKTTTTTINFNSNKLNKRKGR